jgi:hypothetical protein
MMLSCRRPAVRFHPAHHREEPDMRSKLVWALVALNAVLLACLLAQWLRPNAAMAQAAPRPSDYVLIPGMVQGSAKQVIYMLDTQNGWLSARTLSNGKMVDMRPMNLNRIFSDAAPANNTPGSHRTGRGGL